MVQEESKTQEENMTQKESKAQEENVTQKEGKAQKVRSTEEVTLRLANLKDAELIHQMKYEAFLPLYEKYHDDETSPVREKIDKVIWQLKSEYTDYYIICWKGQDVGAVRVVRKLAKTELVEGVLYISPLFILPEYQNRNIAYIALQKVFALYQDVASWKLDTIKQETGNCHLYEKCGFVRVGDEHIINDKMTLIDYEKQMGRNVEICAWKNGE